MIGTINFAPGDIVKVFERIKEGDPSASSGQMKTRTQVFQGKVLGIRGRGDNKTFTVMKVVGEIGVEKIYPIKSVNLEKVELKEHSKKRIRRAKLYYMRVPKPA